MAEKQYKRDEVLGEYDLVISVPFCHAQNLLRGKDRKGYYSNNDQGWQYDVFDVGDSANGLKSCIVTGYGHPSRTTNGRKNNMIDVIDCKMDPYFNLDKKALEVWRNPNLDYNTASRTVESFLQTFITDAENRLLRRQTRQGALSNKKDAGHQR